MVSTSSAPGKQDPTHSHIDTLWFHIFHTRRTRLHSFLLKQHMVPPSSIPGKLVSTFSCMGIIWFHILCSRTLDPTSTHMNIVWWHSLYQENWVTSFLHGQQVVPVPSALRKLDTIFSYMDTIRFLHLHHCWHLCLVWLCRDKPTWIQFLASPLIISELWMQWLHNVILSEWPNETHWTIRVSLEEAPRQQGHLCWRQQRWLPCFTGTLPWAVQELNLQNNTAIFLLYLALLFLHLGAKLQPHKTAGVPEKLLKYSNY